MLTTCQFIPASICRFLPLWSQSKSHLESPVFWFSFCGFLARQISLCTPTALGLCLADFPGSPPLSNVLRQPAYENAVSGILYSLLPLLTEIHIYQKWTRVIKSVTWYFGMCASSCPSARCFSEAVGTSTDSNWHREGHSRWLPLSWHQLSHCDPP